MLRKYSIFLALIVAALAPLVTTASASAATRSEGLPQAYFGVQGLLIVGAHSDVAGTQHGIGGAPLLQLRVGTKRFAFAAEGIPVVSTPQRASAFYGQATPAVGIVNASLEGALDSRARIWVGFGTTIINQRTPLPNIKQVVSSRLVGARFTFRMHEPLRKLGHFVELSFGVAPTLTGADRYVYSDGVTPTVTEDERASEIDGSIALGWQHRATQWLIGVRTLNYSARFTATSEPADRNVGVGPMVEWRHLLK